jgi:hypothetical protein
MNDARNVAAVKDMADPTGPVVNGMDGAVNAIQPGDTFEVEISMSLDPESMLELADALEQTGHSEAQIQASRIRSMLGAPPVSKFKRIMNRNLKVKTLLTGAAILMVATTLGIGLNELFGRYMKRKGRRWATIGNYSPHLAPVSKLALPKK